ncbi:MAG TPA: response regulator transcription factor [Verrucomicrobiae bacterium]
MKHEQESAMKKSKKAAAEKAKKKILIVDDHPIMRQGLALLVRTDETLEVCGEAESASKAVEAAMRLKPDLVIADISLPGRNGLELIKDLHALQPGLPVLVVSMHDESIYAERVLRAGGRGYVMKGEGSQKLMTAIQQVLSGGIFVSQNISAQILELFSGRRSSASPVEKLSDREFEVFQLIGQGRSTREIAAELHISIKTVEVHRVNIKEKLDLKTASELIHYAVRWVDGQGAAGA